MAGKTEMYSLAKNDLGVGIVQVKIKDLAAVWDMTMIKRQRPSL